MWMHIVHIYISSVMQTCIIDVLCILCGSFHDSLHDLHVSVLLWLTCAIVITVEALSLLLIFLHLLCLFNLTAM